MQSKTLQAQIISKNKKNQQKKEHALFSQISYKDVKEINYLCDLEQKKKTIDFPIYQFEKQFGEQEHANELGMLAHQMYKKIMQNGYNEQKKVPSKKKKKTKNPFEYDYDDQFINDQQAFIPKKNMQLKFQNFKSLNIGIDQFYNSQQYRANLSQIQQQSKKRPDLLMAASQLEEIKRQIKQNIVEAHGKMKQEGQAARQTQQDNLNQAPVEAVPVIGDDAGQQIDGQSIKKDDIREELATVEGQPAVCPDKDEESRAGRSPTRSPKTKAIRKPSKGRGGRALEGGRRPEEDKAEKAEDKVLDAGTGMQEEGVEPLLLQKEAE